MKKPVYGFIGLGLIGGSLAKNLKKLDPSCRIMACARTKATVDQALSDGGIDEICTSPSDERFSACSMIFLCAPVKYNIEAVRLLQPHLPPSVLLTDVGSVKTGIHKEISRLRLDSQFIGGHPMTGSEKSGYANATDHLFENAYYILTPTGKTPESLLKQYYDLTLSLKAIPLVLDCREHDYITAAISHLPHVIASSLVNTVHDLDGSEQHMKMIAAGGFRDITRIASSSPQMWESICVDNHENISRVMDAFLDRMVQARDHMCRGDGGYISRMFAASRDYRDSFSFASPGPVKKAFLIYCDIIDESGAIATIATTLAVNSISIKNIGIIHNREFEQGALAIEFYEEQPMNQAVEILRNHRYTVWKSD